MNDSDKEKLNQVAAGLRVNFRVLVNPRIIKWTIVTVLTLFTFSMILLYLLNPNVLEYAPYIFLGVFIIVFFPRYIYLSKWIGFNIVEGIKIYLFQKTWRLLYFILFVSVILYIVTLVILLSLGISLFSPDSQYFHNAMKAILLAIFVLFLGKSIHILYFEFPSDTFILYAINTLEESLSREDKNLYLFERSRIHHSIKIAYDLYKKRTNSWFGREVVDLFDYGIFLKLSTAIGLINDNDISHRKKILRVLKKIEDTSWDSKPKEFINIKNDKDFNDLISRFNLDTEMIEEKSIIDTIKNYIIPIIFIGNLLLIIGKELVKLFS